VYLQQLLKDPKVSLAVLNPYIKRTVKVKSLNDITKREKFSPLTANLMSEWAGGGPVAFLKYLCGEVGQEPGAPGSPERHWIPWN
jgi:hypothetical protein